MGRPLDEDIIIKILERWQKAFKENSHYVSASDLSLVIKDVRELPTIQSVATDTNVGSNSEFPNNSDTVSRQAAIDALDKRFDSIPMDQTAEILKLRKDLRELPPAQPDLSEYSDKLWQKAYERGKAEAQAEIVQCKDCRFNTYSKKCLNPDSFFLVPADDFYCGYAERRTDG